jgi:hypothetical protein
MATYVNARGDLHSVESSWSFTDEINEAEQWLTWNWQEKDIGVCPASS